MKLLILALTILLSSTIQARENVTVCTEDNSGPSLIFKATGRKATLSASSIDIEPQNFTVTKTVKSKTGDPEISEAIGEENISYVQYAVTSEEGEDVIIVAEGISEAKYLVMMGPMNTLLTIGSTANCTK